MGKLMTLVSILLLVCFCCGGCTATDIDMNDPETRRKLSVLVGDMQAAGQANERAQNIVWNVSSYESRDAFGNPNGVMRSTFNGETTVREYNTTYDGPWATTTTTTKTTRR